MKVSPEPVLTLVGPTAVGKSSLAVAVAKRIQGEIVGLDSRQIYRGMEIGTAQPSVSEREGIPHHLIGILRPDQPVSAGEYSDWVQGAVIDIRQRGNQPILCGGAGLYYRALTSGIFPGSVTDLEVRERLNQEYDRLGPASLMDRLQEVDPDYARKVHLNNRKRLVRALEIFESTGKPPSVHFQEQRSQRPSSLVLFTVLITASMEDLEKRIVSRTKTMLAGGWVTEVENLRSLGDPAPLDSIGYREIARHLDGEMDYDTLCSEINLRTRQYARKQLQWFQHESIDLKMDLSVMTDSGTAVNEIVTRYNTFLKSPGGTLNSSPD